jgi:LacI family transcriptional regulator
MAVTLRDVALKAGVSIKTVSRVINNQGEISDITRQHVLGIIDELGYRPNALARSLVSGKSATIALIIPQITDPFFPEVMLGVENVARQHGYSVFLCNTNDDPQQELMYIDLLESKRVDGLILCGSRLSADELTRVAKQHRVSILTSREPRGSAVITILGESGLYEITTHLLRMGHRQIGHIGRQISDEGDRLSGYRRALVDSGIESDERSICQTSRATIDSGYETTKQLLTQAPEITAITCYNDLMAIGAQQACAELQRRVPEDIAIVGFDDIPLAGLVTPSLTTMHVPRYKLGEMIMGLLLRVIAADGKLEERFSVEPHLVIRDSCGARSGPHQSKVGSES